ncbi:MAG: hypothetical protein RJB66_904 [Pseudomonadota bacterium]|jgi:hypothetical protein
MRKEIVFSLIAGVVITMISCGKKSDSSTRGTSPVPEMLKIAQDTLPDGLESTAASMMSSDPSANLVDANLQEMKSRLFSQGPTDFLYRLKMVDDRLDEMATRLSECAEATTQTFNPGAFVTGLSFPMKFGCKEDVNQFPSGIAGMSIYFGKDNGYWYLAEVTHISNYNQGTIDQPSIAVLAKIKDDGTEMDVWQVSVERVSGNDEGGVMHITANKSTGVFSISTGSSAVNGNYSNSSANYSGLGCGVQMITDGTNVYANGKFAQANCGGQSTAQVCVAADLTSAGTCTSLTSHSSLLPIILPTHVNGANAMDMIVNRTGWPTF